jgi:hypothetical protein|eukprot:COSAG03_NODE_551_length_6981_cov_20.070038_3_plen_80_part_00
MRAFEPVRTHAKNGAFITSCIMHGSLMCDTGISIDNLTALGAYAQWFDGRARGEAAIHVDSQLPNGDGTYAPAQCFHFP